MPARLRVLGVGDRSGRTIELGIFCEKGTVRVGGRLVGAIDDRGKRRSVAGEVLEIRFFDHMVDELAERFSANLLVAPNARVPFGEGWTLEVD